MPHTDVQDQIQAKYAAVARSGLSGAAPGVQAVAEAFGYTARELEAVPAEANMGLSCGNPTALARLRPGETVVDLGAGGGLDVLLAARRVGPTGTAIGIDRTPEMVELARANAAKAGAANVDFHLARMESLPLADASADCVISNCVINLSADKPAVFREIFRILKPGGRLAISDIALKRPLPPELAQSVAAHTGCIAGALPIAEYERGLREAGFTAIRVEDARKDLGAYALAAGTGCCSAPASAPASATPAAAAPGGVAGSCCGAAQPLHEELTGLLSRFDVNDYAASVQVTAITPASREQRSGGCCSPTCCGGS